MKNKPKMPIIAKFKDEFFLNIKKLVKISPYPITLVKIIKGYVINKNKFNIIYKLIYFLMIYND